MGSVVWIKLQNWTDREQRVTVFTYLCGEEWVYPEANNIMATPAVIDPEDNEEVFVPLTVRRKYGRRRPQIDRIDVSDTLDRKKTASKQQIEALNTQILNEWPFPEEEWGEETGDIGTIQR